MPMKKKTLTVTFDLDFLKKNVLDDAIDYVEGMDLRKHPSKDEVAAQIDRLFKDKEYLEEIESAFYEHIVFDLSHLIQVEEMTWIEDLYAKDGET